MARCYSALPALWIVFFFYFSVSENVSAVERHYFVAAVEVLWDYAPSGHNLAGLDNEESREKINRGFNRIGSRYKKAVFKGFTDASYTKVIPSPAWAGILGPTVRAEVGDVIYIHFRNMASGSNFSVHPHGVFYSKNSEGALYTDFTTGRDKIDDAVPPGGAMTYTWYINNHHAPLKEDDNCVVWGYHSHVLAPRDIDSGLVGMLLTCRPGTLSAEGYRKDVDRELFVYADVANENRNWYFEENLKNCLDPLLCHYLDKKEDEKFIESNQMYHINGFVYGNLPPFPSCEGEKVVLYFMSLNLGSHTMHINGQTMISERRRVNTVKLVPAAFYSGYMTPRNHGRWLLYCRNQFHFTAGMQGFLDVQACQKPLPWVPKLKHPMATRKYFIAMEEILWNYAPDRDRKNHFVSEDTFMASGEKRTGSIYKKAVFREYTDNTFSRRKRSVVDSKHEHYGLSGPPIKAQVGEHVIVVVYNKASRPYSFLANGVTITKANEGAVYKNNYYEKTTTGAVVNPGSVRVYHFDVTLDDGPTKYDTNCLTNMYHSAVDLSKDIYSGLFGPLIVCRHGTLKHDGKQKGVNREFFLNWMVIDENLSWYIDDNINMFVKKPFTVNKEDDAFKLSNQIRAINGRSFGTLEGLNMCLGDRVAWHMYGLGERFDHHHFGFDGNNFHTEGRRIDTASVFPGIGKTVIMVPDQAGRFNLRNQQLGYEFEGMFASYDVMVCPGHKLPTLVLPPRLVPKAVGIIRRYYIGIIEENWDYCSVKIDPISGRSLFDPDGPGYPYVRNDPKFVGSVYMKALYREFTDETFSHIKARSQEEEHLGMLGPYIKGNVGDAIEIYLSNMASFPYSLIPRNLVFEDGASVSEALPTLPGKTVRYTYIIPERSGPKPQEPNCVGTIYSSRVNPLNDTNSGLFGPMIICKPGVLDYMGRRTDKTTKEFAVSFIVVDENKSNYKDFNFGTRAPARYDTSDEDFVASNQYYSMNGLIYNNLHGLVFSEGEHVAFYILGIGSTLGIHTAHFHGQLYTRRTKIAQRRDVVEVFPGTSETVEMIGYNPGTWLFHCHVSTHARRGMKTTYTVLPTKNKKLIGFA